MKVDLTPEDITNTVEFLARAPLKGAESFVMAMLIQTYKVALQSQTPTPGGEPAENGKTPEKAKAEKVK
ncbi:hypothetical protein LCGC14_0887680 [marine sediment metagenome]|uniref:Uncharacterized protein n=1 Tax=marine sediment metagenome TaxID=412755 RepID=A0A0F9P516_9ZZZZ